MLVSGFKLNVRQKPPEPMTLLPKLRLQRTALLAAAMNLFVAGHAHAQQPASNPQVEALLKEITEQAQRLADQEKALAESRKALEEQQRNLLQERVRFNDLKSKVTAATGRTIPEPQVAQAVPAKQGKGTQQTSISTNTPGQTQAAAAPSGPPGEVGVDRKQEDKPPEIAAVAVMEQGGVLLKKGRLVYTPTLEYTRSSATRVAIQGFSIIPAINIGLFEVTKTDRDTYTTAPSVRYGVTNRFEVELKVPYVYRQDATRTRPVGTGSSSDTLSEVNGNDIGDVEVAARYQINNGRDGWPFLIGNLRYKTATGTNPYEVPVNGFGVETELPTGSGFNAIQPSITAIFPSDPVVFYGNMGYLHNFARSFDNTGEVDPGDSVNASFGMSLSLNDKASFSIGYSHNTVFEPTVNGATPAGATMLQVGTLDLGYSYNLSDRTNLNFGISAGITEDAPDARLTFRLPMSYDL